MDNKIKLPFLWGSGKSAAADGTQINDERISLSIGLDDFGPKFN